MSRQYVFLISKMLQQSQKRRHARWDTLWGTSAGIQCHGGYFRAIHAVWISAIPAEMTIFGIVAGGSGFGFEAAIAAETYANKEIRR